MKSTVIFLTLMAAFYRLQSDEIFTIDCVSTSKALLRTNTTEYIVTLPPGCPYLVKDDIFTLGSKCLGYNKIIVVTRNVINALHLSGGKEARVFTVTCTDKLDENGTVMATSTKVKAHGNPTHYHYHLPVPGVAMYLTTEDPDSAMYELSALPAGHEVNLGQTLYLVIESSRQPEGYYEFFLPDHCEAVSAPPLNLSLHLWNSSIADRCIERPNLMGGFTVYKNGKRYSDQVLNLAFAPVYTFHFQEMYVHDNTITYTCTFLVCPRSSMPAGHCEQELKRLSSNSTQCIKLNTSPVRRRRTAYAPSTGEIETKTLSVTVRIRHFTMEKSQKDAKSETLITVTTGAVTPVIIAVIVFLVLFVLGFRNRRKMKKRDEETLPQTEFELT